MRRATWILWLMLALLPLRGWAVAGMALPQAVHEVPMAVAMADQAAPSMSTMPCHQDVAEPDAGSSCAACDWCHAAMGTAPESTLLGKSPMAGAPAVAPERDTGRPATGGLERPPRSVLA